MITRREAEAYEKLARAEHHAATAKKKMYEALAKVVKGRRPGRSNVGGSADSGGTTKPPVNNR